MKPTSGYYSLIQYCPDLGRLEAANVGVLLFRPQPHFLKALTSRNNRRIIQFFGSEGHDWVRLNLFKKGLEDRIAAEGAEINNLGQLERFIAQRANLLQITPPRPVKILDPDRELEALFIEFLGESARRTPTRTLRRFLAERLNAPGIEKKVRKDIMVRVPVLQKEVEIPFGFQNGRFNLINPVRFQAANIEHSVITACKYAVEGRSLYDNPDPKLGPLELVVVGKFRPKDHESPTRVQRVLQEYRVKLFRTSELPRLIEEIRTTGQDIEELES
jgi:hypothetical protein